MILFWDKPIAVERHICGSNSTAVTERLSESLGLLRVFSVISASWIALVIGLLMTIGGAEAQTTTGTAGTGNTLFSTTFNCHLCHAANLPNRFNAINAGGHIAYANSKGMGGTAGTAQQYADIAAYLATQFTDLGPQSVTFGTATPITIPNIALNTSYGGYVGLQAVSGPSRGSVSFTSTSATYTPVVNQCGSDSFTYQAFQSAANGSGTSNTRTVSLTISNPTVPTVTNNATSGTYNVAFSYNIATTGGTPTSYAASGLPTGLSINTSTGAITGTPTAAGTYTPSITASNCFNGGTQTSATVNPTFTIAKVAQVTLTANAASTSLTYLGTTNLSTAGGSGTGAVTYAVTTNPANCTISGTTLTAAGVGSCIVTATKAADSNYFVASGTVSIMINRAAQTPLSAVATPISINFGATSTLSTTGGSGTGAVTYSVTTNPANCTISVSTLSGAGVGSCTVTATKAADTNYNAATGTVVVTVNATVPGAPTIGVATAGSGQASIAFTPPASDGGSAITGYTATCMPGGTGTNMASPVVVTGLTNGTSYTCKVVANNAIGSSVNSLPTSTFTPASQGPTLWSNTCSGCHGNVPAGNRFNAAGVTGSVLNYVRQTQPAMASIQGIQALTATDLADLAAYILQYVPPVSVATRFNTAKLVSVSSQITLNTISFTNIQVTGSPANGTLSAPTGTALTYTPNAGFVGTDTFTYRGVGTPLNAGTLFGEDRTVLIQVLMMGVITVPAAPTIGTATPGGSKATVNFMPPADDGGSAIMGYTVACNSGGAPVTSTGSASPITVTGLTDGQFYFCNVTATNAMGTSAASATVDVTPIPTLLAAVSRKTHGSVGPFDIIIDISQLIGGLVTTEPRASDAGGAGHKVVFQFDGPITVAGAPDILNAIGSSVGNVASVVANGNAVEVTFTGIPDNTRVTVSLLNVNNIVNASASVGFFVGDVNNSRSVNASDIIGVKARSGKPTDASNFKFDLNASGDITSSDISAVKARSGIVLAP